MGWFKNLFRKSSINKPVVVVPPAPPLTEIPSMKDLSNFDAAVKYTLLNEGVLSDDAGDSGGITKYGIIMDDLINAGYKNPTRQTIIDLTEPDAIAIYKKLYWDVNNLDQCKDKGIAVCMFDVGVVQGISWPKKYALQICGSNDFAVINQHDANKFIDQFAALTKARFQAIADNNLKDKKFLQGWVNRADRLLTLKT